MPTEALPLPNPNTYWVVPGQFLAGEYPGDKDLSKAREKITRFIEVGIRHFIDLTESGELIPYESILSEEARNVSITATYQRFPIRDLSVPSDSDHISPRGSETSHDRNVTEVSLTQSFGDQRLCRSFYRWESGYSKSQQRFPKAP